MSGRVVQVLFSPPGVLFYRWEVVGRCGPPATSNTGSIIRSGVSGLCHRGGLQPVLSRAGGSVVGGGPVAMGPAFAGIFGLRLGGLLVSCPPVDFPWMNAASSVRPCWFLLGFGMLGCISSVCSWLLCALGVHWVLRYLVVTSHKIQSMELIDSHTHGYSDQK